jgi:hypothetical protein
MPLLTLPTGEKPPLSLEMTRQARRGGHLKAIVKKPGSTERYSTADKRRRKASWIRRASAETKQLPNERPRLDYCRTLAEPE